MTDIEYKYAVARADAAIDVAAHIRFKLSNARVSLGITIQEAARMTGLPVEVVERCEAATGNQPVGGVLRLAAAYGIDARSLVTGTNTDGGK